MSEVEKIRNMVEIQGKQGTWNDSAYMTGLYNGLELALATLEGREADFREIPGEKKVRNSINDDIKPSYK